MLDINLVARDEKRVGPRDLSHERKQQKCNAKMRCSVSLVFASAFPPCGRFTPVYGKLATRTATRRLAAEPTLAKCRRNAASVGPAFLKHHSMCAAGMCCNIAPSCYIERIWREYLNWNLSNDSESKKMLEFIKTLKAVNP